MNNRPSLFPILFFPVFGLLVSVPLLTQAEPGVPSANVSSATNEPAAPTVPAVTAPAATTPPPAPPSIEPVPATADAPTERPATYTVAAGDSLGSIAHKYECSVKSLMKLNNLTKKDVKRLKPGQVLKIPPATGLPTTSKAAKSPAPTPAPTTRPNASVHQPKAKAATHKKSYAQAQPVQDFDIPASNFASCPVPIPPTEPDTDTDASTPSTTIADTDSTPPLRAELVSPSEFNPAPAPKPKVKATVPTETAEVAPLTAPVVASTSSSKHTQKTIPVTTPSVAASTPSTPSSSSKQGGRGLFGLFYTPPTNDWSSRFLKEARALGDQGIEYDEDWRPPGERHAWAMDCSNTSRYLYKVTAGIELPRTASDQYYYLHLQNKAWDVPQASNGYADCNFLRENLKVGDLLFWENTYRPERQPPITHVMVFLGTNDKGQWIMAGSQTSRGGEHNRRNGGPDIYVFDPTKPCGGYSTWLGMVHHKGRFCAYGRPLEADPSKLSVAANN